ncbi:MAG: chloride channel protein [Deltaproteobacteria bacterium]|nr:chloride channel protein [Deltaproteobacteria bacterium]MBW2070964.1 chloride channel protein [Deltaproteobacteria bacterium]
MKPFRQTAKDRSLKEQLRRLFRRYQLSDQTFLIVVAVVVGFLGGLGTILFEKMLEFFNWLFFEVFPHPLGNARWLIILIPALGGLFLAPLIRFFPAEAKSDGVPATMEAVALKRGIIKVRTFLIRTLASALTLGSGGSAGKEGPIIQIGASIGSAVGQFFRVSGDRMRVLVGCGAAAGLASIFNAPIAGVLFALEVVLGEFNIHIFSPIVISSVVATAVSRAWLIEGAALKLPPYHLFSYWEILLYAVLGICAGVVSVVFTRTLHGMEDLFEHHAPLKAHWKPIFGGLAVGMIGFFYPQILGCSYAPITQAIQGDFLWQTLVALLVLKVVGTAFTLGSGGSGGILYPSLFLGAMVGGALGDLFHTIFPQIVSSPGGYALVGMGAVLGAAVQAPMAAIMMVFELTNDYAIILPMMTACVLATVIHRRLMTHSIYTYSLVKRGIDISAGREMGILTSLKVKDIMSRDVPKIPGNLPYEEVLKHCLAGNRNYLYTIDEQDNLEGVISFQELKEFVYDDQLRHLVFARDLANRDVVYVTPDETLASSLNKFSSLDVEELPVVQSYDGQHRLEGIVTRSELMRIYRKEMGKRLLIN